MGEPVTDQGNILKCDVNWDYSIDAADVVLLLDIINWKK